MSFLAHLGVAGATPYRRQQGGVEAPGLPLKMSLGGYYAVQDGSAEPKENGGNRHEGDFRRCYQIGGG